jgi:hypothetical protein
MNVTDAEVHVCGQYGDGYEKLGQIKAIFVSLEHKSAMKSRNLLVPNKYQFVAFPSCVQ